MFVGILSSVASDAGYLVLIPLGAAAFISVGRHPLAGLAAAFAGVAARLPVNVLIVPDRRHADRDHQRRDPPASNPTGRSTSRPTSGSRSPRSILLAIVVTLVTERIVEPRLGPYAGDEAVGSRREVGLTPRRSAACASPSGRCVGVLVVIALLVAAARRAAAQPGDRRASSATRRS